MSENGKPTVVFSNAVCPLSESKSRKMFQMPQDQKKGTFQERVVLHCVYNKMVHGPKYWEVGEVYATVSHVDTT